MLTTRPCQGNGHGAQAWWCKVPSFLCAGTGLSPLPKTQGKKPLASTCKHQCCHGGSESPACLPASGTFWKPPAPAASLPLGSSRSALGCRHSSDGCWRNLALCCHGTGLAVSLAGWHGPIPQCRARATASNPAGARRSPQRAVDI